MKNSILFIGLGVGLLVGAAMGLYIATDEEKKARVMDDIKNKTDDAKKSIGKVVKQGLDELDKAVEAVNKAAKDTISKIGKGVPAEESVE